MARRRGKSIFSRLGKFLYKMSSSSVREGSISSKIVVGSVTYISLVIAAIVAMFVSPDLPGLSEIIITLSLTSASLIGLTTVENIRNRKHHFEDSDEN